MTYGPNPSARSGSSARYALPEALIGIVGTELERPPPPETERLVRSVRARFGEAVAGVILYGSCLRTGDLTEGLADLYVVVDDYRRAYRSRWLRLGNRVLPPNVFYLEERTHESVLRAKYAIISLAHLEEGCGAWFHPYLWARFAQPARLVYTRDPEAGQRIVGALSTAPVRFLTETHPLLANHAPFEAETLWAEGLARTYASELRAERGRARHLTEAHAGELERTTGAAAPAVRGLERLPDGRYRSRADSRGRTRTGRRWWIRRVQGRVLSVLRLIKASTTFEGGIDYLAWKLERHTGEVVAVTPRLRRYPVLGGLALLVRLLRRGTVR